MVPYMPINSFACFRNDTDKRTFMSAGSSAGVSAAFGAPIGGTLFTYEISKPNTFWTFGMLWRVFISSAMSTFTLGICEALKNNGVISLDSASLLKFGNTAILYSPLSDAPAAVLIGVIAGLLGALFVNVNARLSVMRKKLINTPTKKIIEVMFFSFITSSVFFWMSAASKLCLPTPTADT